MVSVCLFRPLRDHGVDFLANATVARGKLAVDGPRADLVDTSRPMYSTRLGVFVDFADEPEEWLRSLADSFRSAQVVAAIVKDTQHKDLVAPPETIQRLQSAQLAAH